MMLMMHAVTMSVPVMLLNTMWITAMMHPPEASRNYSSSDYSTRSSAKMLTNSLH